MTECSSTCFFFFFFFFFFNEAALKSGKDFIVKFVTPQFNYAEIPN